MAYGITVQTYNGLENVTNLRSVKPSFTQTLSRGTNTNISMPSGLTYSDIFFHWSSNLQDADLLKWTSPTNLYVSLASGVGSITLYFRAI